MLEKLLLNLEIEGDNTLSVQVERVHFVPQLSRQLGVCICPANSVVKIFFWRRPNNGALPGGEGRGLCYSLRAQEAKRVSGWTN